MPSDVVECLHCGIIQEIGRRLEGGQTTGQEAIDSLVAVIADILATAPADHAKVVLEAIISELPAAEANARERLARTPTLERSHTSAPVRLFELSATSNGQ